MKVKLLLILMFFCGVFYSGFSQQISTDLNAAKIKLYSPYMAARHGGEEGLEKFKLNNRVAYQKEMWYFTESFYIKRNHLDAGITMDEGMIDITRFESLRKTDTDTIIELPGFKDALVLLASNKLLFKSQF